MSEDDPYTMYLSLYRLVDRSVRDLRLWLMGQLPLMMLLQVITLMFVLRLWWRLG
jgi:hypothetical protein